MIKVGQDQEKVKWKKEIHLLYSNMMPKSKY